MANIKEEPQSKKVGFALGKSNYIYLSISFVIIIIGYLLMSGGGTHDPKVFTMDIFSFRRITLAPVVVMIGYIMAIFAIMKQP